MEDGGADDFLSGSHMLSLYLLWVRTIVLRFQACTVMRLLPIFVSVPSVAWNLPGFLIVTLSLIANSCRVLTGTVCDEAVFSLAL
jgi:hypothetical protein